MPRPKVPDIGVDPDLILNPAFRRFFGKESNNIFTAYGLILRVLCKMFYRDEIRSIEQREKTKDSPTRMVMKPVRINEWRKGFKKTIFDLTKAGQKMLNLDNVPAEEEVPDSNIVSLRMSGREALRGYKENEKRRMKVMIDLMEDQLDSLWGEIKGV